MTNHAHDAERSVLGGILITCETIPPGLELLSPGDFADPRHAEVFAAMLRLAERREPIDTVTVRDECKALPAPKDGWGVWLATLTESVATAANVGYWAQIVRREALRRDAIRATAEAIEKLKNADSKPEQVLVDFSTRLGALAAGRQLDRPRTARELVGPEIKAIERRASGEVTGLPTGFAPLDNMLGGLDLSGLIVLGGRPSMGKSALATGIAQNVVLRGGDSGAALVFSLEMAAEQQVQRAIASEGRVNLNHIRRGKLNADAWDRVITSCAALNTDRLAYVDSVPTISEIRGISRVFAAKHKLALIVVDYLQLVPPEDRHETREQQVAAVSRGLKALAMELRIPVLALSQLSRAVEMRQDKRPMLSDLRESGSLEQDASQVLFVYRDEYYFPDSKDRGLAEICAAKNRNGPTGTIKLRWAGAHTRFDAVDADQQTMRFGAEGSAA